MMLLGFRVRSSMITEVDPLLRLGAFRVTHVTYVGALNQCNMNGECLFEVRHRIIKGITDLVSALIPCRW